MTEIIQMAIFQNNLLKESFLAYAHAYFRESYIPAGNDLEHTPWAYLFNEYLELSKKYPRNVQQPIDKVIESIGVDSMWNKKLSYLYRHARDFIVSSQYYADEMRLEHRDKNALGFTFEKVHESGIRACYTEHYQVPNHANVVVQTENQEAADWLADMLWRVGAEKDLGMPQKTFAIKLVDKSVSPVDYMGCMIQNSRVMR
ncbi:MAG: hypothetical protein LBJ73_01465 [Rickettsiales bacterium]|jgi:hypothetical protein|nr:hypothetical protein [Rickettsiales bacterium]